MYQFFILTLYSFVESSSPILFKGHFGVCCSVRKVFWRREIIVEDVAFTEICEYIIIGAVGVCCLIEKIFFGCRDGCSYCRSHGLTVHRCLCYLWG